ncbi:MAG: CAP domain-containing protein [Actinomycetota bacterium]
MPRRYRSVVVLLVVSLCLVAGSSAVAGGSCYHYSKKDRKLAKKTNSARAGRDIRKMTLDPHLSRVAKRQARAMASKNYLYHTPSLGSLVTKWKILGENVGYAGSVKKVHRAFMNSPAHKANILRWGFKYVGVGVTKGGGHIWASVVFEGKKNPGTTLEMPSC